MDWSAEFQQNQDGFIFGKYTIINNSSSLCFRQDSLSGYTNYMQMSVEREDVFCFPIKKDNVWSFRYNNATIDKIYWVPLESGGGSSSSASNQSSNSYNPISSSQSPYNPLLGDYHVFDINYPTVNHIIVPSGKHFRSTYSTVNNCDSFVVYRGSESYSFTSVSVIEKMILIEND